MRTTAGFGIGTIGALGAAGAFVCTGCIFSGDDSGTKDIFPLVVGNAWTYVDSAYYSEDSVTTSTSETSISGTREIEVGGETRTVFLSNSHAVGGAPSPFSIYVGNIGHSNYNFGAEQDTFRVTGRQLHLEYPTRAGRRYPTVFYGFRAEGNVLVATTDTIDIEVVDPHQTCTVPAGTFACVQFRGYHPDGSLFATAWHAPGVGYLGYEIRRTERVGDSLREVLHTRRLTSYTLH